MNYFILLLLGLTSSICYGDASWQQHWHLAKELWNKQQYQEASIEFDSAVNLMSENEQNQYPYVFVERAELAYFLGDTSKAFKDTEIAIKSTYLTEEERLTCALRRISILMNRGEEEIAIDEYKKYIIPCPLFPQYHFSKDKIIIRNMLNCSCYKELTKKLMLSEFCQKEKDIYDYGNTWIVNITKENRCCDCGCENKTESIDDTSQTKSTRSPDQIQACCNTVNRFAVAANVICGCLSIPTGPVTAGACKVACVVFVEAIRQTCEWCCYNGGIEEKCWKKFETWKTDFKKENPQCPQPPLKCP